MFDHILNWKLLGGSHRFPGPDGGTCINEAATVAAGFKYKEITVVSDCPPCFSRVLASYLMKLNDTMPDDLRQELLLPFVTRLAGTFNEHETPRANIIVNRTIKEIFPKAIKGDYFGTVGRYAILAEQYLGLSRPTAVVHAVRIAGAVVNSGVDRRIVYTIAASIAEEAINIGPSSSIEQEVAVQRFNEIKETARKIKELVHAE